MDVVEAAGGGAEDGDVMVKTPSLGFRVEKSLGWWWTMGTFFLPIDVVVVV